MVLKRLGRAAKKIFRMDSEKQRVLRPLKQGEKWNSEAHVDRRSDKESRCFNQDENLPEYRLRTKKGLTVGFDRRKRN